MALSDIRFANKKAKREARRKKHHALYVTDKDSLKIRNKRMRKMMIEGRRLDLAQRAEAIKYVNQLENELGDD